MRTPTEQDELQQEINEELARALKALTETVVQQTVAEHERLAKERQAKKPVTPFPFAPLEWVLTRGLRVLEQTIQRVVAAVVR